MLTFGGYYFRAKPHLTIFLLFILFILELIIIFLFILELNSQFLLLSCALNIKLIKNRYYDTYIENMCIVFLKSFLINLIDFWKIKGTVC